jgi:hypothetical protein
MTKKEEIKKAFSVSIKESAKLQLFLEGKLDKEQLKGFSFQTELQIWYSKAIKLMEIFGSDRLNEFKSYYEVDPKRKFMGYGTYVIQDYLKGIKPSRYESFDHNSETSKNLYNQYTILNSIFERLDSVLFNVESELIFEFQELELINAKNLLKINVRASGVIAGVILESHLGKVAENHSLKIPKKNPTLIDLNDFLKSNNIHNVTSFKKIQYLSDLRNLCAHKKDTEPTKEQIEELLEGVNWALKNIN